ncbi:dienelactone hydrolase [Gorgonomyces haynaldii]|nr:dienelactone hydrolase [Gorgonomyces haynaldii]
MDDFPNCQENRAIDIFPMTTKLCCAGVQDEGTPIGTLESIGGQSCYVSKGTATNKAIVLVTDVFGLGIKNPKLLADAFAKETGFSVYVPDLFKGKEVPPQAMDSMEALMNGNPSFFEKIGHVGSLVYNFVPFAVSNSQKQSLAIVKDVIHALRTKESVQSIGVVGYCWGGGVAIELAQESNKDAKYDKLVTCIAPTHAGGYNKQKYENINIPALHVIAEKDMEIKEARRAEIRAITESKQDQSIAYFEGVMHGFAVRGDYNNPVIKKARDEAFSKTAEFFKNYV